jgi:hypothetical protein
LKIIAFLFGKCKNTLYIYTIIITQKLTKMKTLLKKIDQLTEKIELGFYTKSEAMFKLRELRSEVAEKFEEGSDKFMQCIYPLIDANEIAKRL